MDIVQVLDDAKSYPDDMKINIAGQETTVGELRSSAPFKGFTKYSQQQSNERRELESKLAAAQAEREKVAQDLAVALAARNNGIPGNQNTNDEMAALRSDPMFGPLVQKMERVDKENEELKKKAEQFERIMWQNSHVSAIKDIQSHDTDFKDPVKVNELINYARNNGLSDLTRAHKEMTRDRDIRNAIEEGKKQGIEEGRKKALSDMAIVPSGFRRPAMPAPDDPKTFDEAEDAALRDGEILNIFQGGGG